LEELLRISEFQKFYQSATLAVDAKATTTIHSPAKSVALTSAPDIHVPTEISEDDPIPEKAAAGRFTYDEDRSNAALGFHAMTGFFRELSSPRGAKTLLFSVTAIAISIPFLQIGWIEHWKKSEYSNSIQGVWIYLGIGVAAAIFHVAQRKVWMEAAFRNSRSLHEKALGHVMASPLGYFERTPVGRLVNRFSRDLEVVEWDISIFFSHFIHHSSDLNFRIILLVVLLPWFLVALPMIAWIFLNIQRRFRPASRDTKRLSLMARSPRYAFFKETLSHLVTMRALSREKAFDRIFQDLLGQYQISLGAMFLLNRWYSSRIPWLSAVVGAVTAGSVIILNEFAPINSYRIGFTMMVALGFFEILNWTVREFSELESRMTSWERVHALNALPPEEVSPVPAPRQEWPSAGLIEFKDFFFKYPEADTSALQNISVTIPAGQKVAIVGKTGSGKSTLVQSLFRFVTPQSGQVLIDGIDLQTLALEQLRRSLSYIPQDPIMILGTLRSNLDRWNERSDAEVWEALKQVNMENTVRALPNGLHTFVTENGLNFSRGERQMLCLARALLTRSKILILDEATSSVDGTTDLEIQRVVQEHFSTATVLTIAHRLGTLRHCNRVIELSQGRILRDTVRVDKEDPKIEPIQNHPTSH
jgi:ABC-type multidrug transport system fused ATPase/permease subunit